MDNDVIGFAQHVRSFTLDRLLENLDELIDDNCICTTQFIIVCEEIRRRYWHRKLNPRDSWICDRYYS